ncbi:MAG: Sensor histidine kinase RcsC [Chroococcidiopsis cubana SAG 39.79]|uniref:histidine kinase n=1 Tax=Chroococcidiopsis cubana SAG 39.79 TaxID=388085 RepID=A0AB37ULX6_9CYAN|nr:ATP-binding protein [Chroococcidiopsis cubana]MDZ4874956.1 Sensor histidine kinase RcsC [Chroococcidiopsis cubana SAG 39.79]RUT12341.1 hypothetical protein DSM107010_23510 [Chroococcidiopsis cubana SAG 39.79]
MTPQAQYNSLSETIFAGGGEMGALMRSHDWSQTPLGPVEFWSQSLRTAVSICLLSTSPLCALWGRDLILLYNDGYRPIIAKHPQSLGRSIQEWSEWHNLRPIVESVLQTGQPTYFENNRQLINRNGCLEEAYFTFFCSPIRDETGEVAGIFQQAVETTVQVVSDRRLRTLRELGAQAANTKTVDEACQISARVLANNPRDTPFALIYLLDGDRASAQLVSTTNLAAGTPDSPSTIEFSTVTADCWSLNSVLATGQSRVIENLVARFEPLPGGAWSQLPNSAIVLPLKRPEQAILGFLIVGISPFRPLDDDYRGFFDLVAGQVTTAIANTLAYEEGRKWVEEALCESEGKYRTLFNTMDEGFCILQLIFDEEQKPIDYRYIEINPVFEKQTGMKNALGKTIRELVPDMEPFWFDIYGKVALTGEPTHFEDHAVAMDRWFDVNAIRIGEPHERKVGVLFNDITARKQAEAAMRAFFSNVSHEFRTPLTLLLSSIQETLSDRTYPLTPTQQEQLQLADRNAMRLLKLVNTLLDFSRIEAGRVEAVYEPTDLATFTAELASVFRSAIERTSLHLAIDCPPLPEPIYVDREMWEKIVLNLISNAFKFTFTGAITVRLHQVGDWVELAVQDTGIGVPAAEIPRLFERFHRVKGAQGRTFEGSGIGLSLVQELVKLHGGTLKVSSVEGEGSCFSVFIPTGRAHLPAERIGANRTITSTAIGAFPYVEEVLQWLPQEDLRLPIADFGLDRNSNEQTKNLKSQIPNPKSQILLVDDNADMRDYLKRLLSQRWQVETAANGAIALNLIQQQLPDLVLTDVMMPEMDGFALLEALRADPVTKSIPIILLSARAGEEATIEGLEAGADDYLIKPFSARELVARVETQLQMSRLRQEQSANRLKNEFLMTVTHELQAPLAAILGWARLLQTKPFDQTKIARALATIERNATIEAKLVKDLLDVSSILSGKLRLKPQLVDLVSLVQNVVTTFREAAGAKTIQLGETRSNVTLGNVLADGDRLRQVIANLLDNAIKFTPKGGQVDIRLEHLNSVAQITVTDTGIGIAPEFLPQVFDRFSQAEVPSRHSPGGVGIGLAIARHLVELHHGTIEAASEGEGRGATFTVKLPLV